MANINDKEELFWVYPKEDQEWKEKIIKEFNIHPVSAQILVSRGFTDLEEIQHYLYAQLPDLHDPFNFSQMETAVERILQAIKNNDTILVYGDNDVDGMTGTALLTEFFQLIGLKCLYFVSHPKSSRREMIVESLDFALENECKLLITVDCGITAANNIAKFVDRGIDVIVTDHHEPTDKIPNCVATLNPKLFNNPYPNRHLTGVGVAFKFAHALTNRLVADGIVSPKKIDLKRFLDLVAMGTISDMGVLLGENRIFVRYGLKQMEKNKRIGLAKLFEVADLRPTALNTFSIASKIAPRLNSLGRIAEPKKGVELLLLRNSAAAEKLAKELDLNNIERQKIERTISDDVENIIKNHPETLDDKAVVLSSDRWHPGVIAILSTRISKSYNRPAVMIAVDGDTGKASLRSISEFPLLSILKDSSDLLINFGGHDFAAGLTLKKENIPEFKKRFITAANNQLKAYDVKSKLYLDAKVNFEDLTFECMESIRLLEPFGHENPPPILYSDAKQAWPPKVVGKSHLKLFLEQKIEKNGQMSTRFHEGIAFYRAASSPRLRIKDLTLSLAFTPQIDHYLEKPSIKFVIRDFKILPDPVPTAS